MVAIKQPVKKKFLNSINYFRGIAIIIIVMAHTYGIARWDVYNQPSVFETFFYSLNLNGSVFFIFISGFLYNHIFYPRFNYKKFMIKKLKFVLLPYLVCSAIPIFYAVGNIKTNLWFDILFDHNGRAFLPDAIANQPILSTIWFLVTGRAMYAYWYIPMIMLVFAISPLINKLIRSKYLLDTILFLMPISMIVHRPAQNMNPLHSLVYFLPVYLLGIYSSIHQKQIYEFLKSNQVKIAILLAAVSLGLIQVLMFNVSGNFSKDFFSITVPDINLIQKILLCFLLISILDKYEDTDIKSMNKTAETSFAIYFIHPFLLRPFNQLSRNLGFDFQGNIFTLFIATFCVIITAMAIAHLFKLIFKRNSRYLIGW